eukprot:TRINITY_DN5818_c0_g1_i1.p1 TRINITY_DN5818_c0_g1~~TRINITY_DN5818_c0_g1_i1.p1  ORF type:complete len:301 (-),score=30.45 TRINITY_DN5818_c0_g1_i1:43-945(-)
MQTLRKKVKEQEKKIRDGFNERTIEYVQQLRRKRMLALLVERLKIHFQQLNQQFESQLVQSCRVRLSLDSLASSMKLEGSKLVNVDLSVEPVLPVTPAIALISLDEDFSGLVSPSQLYIALVQSGIYITWTEVFFLWTRYRHSQKLSWLDLLAECGGLSQVNVKHLQSNGNIFESIDNDLRKWEAYLRNGVEQLEGRSCLDEDLLRYLLYRPRNALIEEGPLVLQMDHLDGRVSLRLQPSIQVFLTTDEHDKVSVSIEIPQLENMKAVPINPIFEHPLLIKFAEKKRKKERRRKTKEKKE